MPFLPIQFSNKNDLVGAWRDFKKILCGKVHIFWEAHKILRNLHRRFVLKTVQVDFVVNTVLIQYCFYYEIYSNILYVVPVKSVVEMSQNFVAFSEYMNFIYVYCKWNFKPKISSIFHFEFVNEVWISALQWCIRC